MGTSTRTYWNPKTGAKVVVAVLYGARGPIAVHTPEICYSGKGTKPLGERSVVAIGNEENSDRLWEITLSKGSDPSPSLEVWYAWSDGGPWFASEHPRFWMTDSLYKIQVAGSPSKNDDEGDCKNFLKYFLPELRTKLKHP